MTSLDELLSELAGSVELMDEQAKFDYYIYKAHTLFWDGEFRNAENSLTQAKKLLINSNNHLINEAKYLVALLKSNVDKQVRFPSEVKRAQEVANELIVLNNPSSSELAGELFTFIAIITYRQNTFQKAIDFGSRAIDLLEGRQHFYVLSLANNIVGMSYLAFGSYAIALNFFIDATKYEELMIDQLILDRSTGYANLSMAYEALDQPEKAEIYQRLAVEILKGENQDSALYSQKLNLAMLYSKQLGFGDEALAILNEVEQYYDGHEKENVLGKMRVYQAKAKVYYDNFDFDSATKMIDKAILNPYRTANQARVQVYAFLTGAQIYSAPKNEYQSVKKARKYLNKIYDIIGRNVTEPIINTLEANVFVLEGSYDDALAIYSNTINGLLGKSEMLNGKISESDFNLLLQSVLAKHLVYRRVYDKDYPEAIIDEMKADIIPVLDLYDQGETPFSPRSIVIDELMKIISENLLVYHDEGDKDHILKVFQFKQLSLSNRISALKRNRSLAQDSIEQKRDHLNRLIASLKRSIGAQRDSINAVDLNYQLLQAQSQLDALRPQQEFEKIPLINIEDAQKNLTDKEVLLDWLVAGEHIFCLAITNNDWKLITIDKREDLRNKEWIALHKMLNGDQILSFEKDQERSLYNKLNLFYKRLFSDLEPILTNKTDLIILEDEILELIPFELFITEMPESDDDLPKYLVEDKTIRHIYSWYSLEIDLVKEQNSSQKIGVFTMSDFRPDKNDSIKSVFRSAVGAVSELGNLEFVDSEKDFLNSNFAASTFHNSDCTEEKFKREANNYGILHIGTHAIINQASKYHSFLAMNSGKGLGNDGMLDLAEILTLRLNNQLVVLSACNTGNFVERGSIEPLSLGFAFQYAGAKSVVSSKWKVPDESTFKLMQFFYAHLKDGEDVSVALRKAKLNYLNSESDPLKRHPHFWAGFVVTGGNLPAIPKERSSALTLILISTIVLILMALLFLRKHYKPGAK